MWWTALVPLAQALPVSLSHQGRLMDATGVPIQGTHDVGIALYDEGGTALWSDVVTAEFDNGYFHVVVEADTGVDNDKAVSFGISVDGGPEIGRLDLHSVPYARRAAVAESVEDESDPLFDASAAADVTSDDVDNLAALAAHLTEWTSAYGWGDHSQAGYLTEETAETDPVFDASAAADVTTDDVANLAQLAAHLAEWTAAYGWGDHSQAGYLTTETVPAETDPIFDASAASDVTSDDVTNLAQLAAHLTEWTTAYGWGDHSSAGYVTAETDPVYDASAAADVTSDDVTNLAQLAAHLTEWTTAYGWGDHSQAGYLTAETDPVFDASAAADVTAGDVTNLAELAAHYADWNSAYNWGNHADEGYLTSDTLDDLDCEMGQYARFNGTEWECASWPPGVPLVDASSPFDDALNLSQTTLPGGQIGMAHRTVEQTHTGCYPEWARSKGVEIDPTKTYEFRIWIRSTETDMNNYFGFYLYDSSSAQITTGTLNNPYFKSSENDPDLWVLWRAYLLPTGTPDSNGDGLPDTDSPTTNGLDYVMPSNAVFAQIRFGGCYADGSGTGYGWYAHPSIREADLSDAGATTETTTVPPGTQLVDEITSFTADAMENVTVTLPGGWEGSAHQSTETNTGCYNWAQTGNIAIDPRRTYEFSIWIKSDGTDLDNYMGFYAYDAGGAQITTNQWNNPYFKTGQSDANAWKKWTGYLLPHTTPDTNADGLPNVDPSATNGLDYRFPSNAAYARIRFGACYGDGSGGNKTWFAHPSVKEVDLSTL